MSKINNADYELPIILGSVIAHEIGHLLLGPNAHMESGIMQAQWTREQLNQAFRGRLMFTLAQQRLSARKLRFDSGAIARMSPINSSDLTRAYTAAETLIAVPELIYRIKEQRQQHRLRLSNDRFTKTRCV
jgi:hypothetical protein